MVSAINNLHHALIQHEGVEQVRQIKGYRLKLAILFNVLIQQGFLLFTYKSRAL